MVASLVAEPGLQSVWASVVVTHGVSDSAGMWDLPGPGIEPMSPALADRFLTTGPLGKSFLIIFLMSVRSLVIPSFSFLILVKLCFSVLNHLY